ncbi:MAG: hypothetical protein GY758_12635 [Fuerstiella sp.]|nr:hypothetical protein [Fuerstiella sp.]MCP4506585.1 hypothetical protein [Fuerstiella sp.]
MATCLVIFWLARMSQGPRLYISQIQQGDSSAAGESEFVVCDESPNRVAAKLAVRNPGQTLQATALVHEAYAQLAGVGNGKHWIALWSDFDSAAEADSPHVVGIGMRTRVRSRNE